MFVDNYYKLINQGLIYFTGVTARDASNNILANILLRNGSNIDYYINPGSLSSNIGLAKECLSHDISNIFRFGTLFIGYASNEDEFNDLSSHATGIPTVNGGVNTYISGDDKKYWEVNLFHGYSNNTQNPVTMNKLTVSASLYNFWTVSTSAAVNSIAARNFPMLIDRFDPIIMAPGESRKFTLKIRFPLFY